MLEETGPLDPAFYYFMDWDLWLRAGLRRPIVYEPVLLSTYRLHPQSKTVAQARRSAPELEYMYRKYFEGEEVPPEIRCRQGEAFANMYFTSAGYFIRGGDRKAGRQNGLASRCDPIPVGRCGFVRYNGSSTACLGAAPSQAEAQ